MAERATLGVSFLFSAALESDLRRVALSKKPSQFVYSFFPEEKTGFPESFLGADMAFHCPEGTAENELDLVYAFKGDFPAGFSEKLPIELAGEYEAIPEIRAESYCKCLVVGKGAPASYVELDSLPDGGPLFILSIKTSFDEKMGLAHLERIAGAAISCALPLQRY